MKVRSRSAQPKGKTAAKSRAGGSAKASARKSSTAKSSKSSRGAKAQGRVSTSAKGRAAGNSARKASKSKSSSAGLTTDHDEIRQWVEERGGFPATVKRTTKGKQAAGVLRVDFPGFSGKDSLKRVSWDEWFEVFDKNRLGFLRQERTANGKPSRFNKLVCRT